MSSDSEGAGTTTAGQSDVSTARGVDGSPKEDLGDKGRADRARERLRSMPTHTFGPASEEPYRRRTSDWVRVAVTLVALGLLVGYHDNPSAANQDLFRFFNGLPNDLQPFFQTLYWAGTLWTVLVVAAAAFIGRRWRLARDLTIAGVLAALVARVMAQLVDEQSLSKTFDEVSRLGQSPQFPLVRLAVVTAVVGAAVPYVTRPTRRLGQLLVFALGFSAMYLGTGYPSDILAALFLGWGVAALVHLAFGSPGGRPTTAQVAASLAELGVTARDVHLDPTQPTGASRFLAQDDQGPLSVRVIGRDEADSQFLAKLWRFVVYKDSGPQLYLTREQDVEHEAYILLLAERAAVQVPDVIVAGTAGPGAALIVGHSSTGRVLADLNADEATDDLLTDLWHQVRALHDALDRARRVEHASRRGCRRTSGDHGLHGGDERGQRAPARR